MESVRVCLARTLSCSGRNNFHKVLKTKFDILGKYTYSLYYQELDERINRTPPGKYEARASSLLA